MTEKAVWFRRAGVDIHQPVVDPVGTYRNWQYLGTFNEKCTCGEVHDYDAYVSFTEGLRGGWVPHFKLRSSAGETYAKKLLELYTGPKDVVDFFTYLDRLVAEDWWIIYCKGRDGAQ